MLEQILIESLLGAITGYVTNDIALKQLFRDGGVIEKEKDEFIQALIALLKEEIFTKDVIEKILLKDEVGQFIENFSHTFFETTLPRALSDVRINTFPNYDRVKDEMIVYLGSKEGNHDSLINLEGIYDNFISLIKEDVLSESIDILLNHFAKESFKEILGEERYQKHIKEHLKDYVDISEDDILDKCNAIYFKLSHSDFKLKDYLTFSPSELASHLIQVFRESLISLENKATLNDLLASPEFLTIYHKAENRLGTYGIDKTVCFLSAKEDRLTALFYEALIEATEDLADSSRQMILASVQNFFAKGWIKRESKGLKLDTSKLKFNTKEKMRAYVFSDDFGLFVESHLKAWYDLPLKEVFKRYGNQDVFLDVLKSVNYFS